MLCPLRQLLSRNCSEAIFPRWNCWVSGWPVARGVGQGQLYPRIAPEAYNDFYRQSLYHGMLRLLSRQFEFLRRHYSELPEDVRGFASQILEKEDTIGARFRTLYELRIEAVRIRYHGQMVLEHVLATGRDFTFIDFEGDPGATSHRTQHQTNAPARRSKPAAFLRAHIPDCADASSNRRTSRFAASRAATDMGSGVVCAIHFRNASWLLGGYWPTHLLPPTLEQQQALLDVHLIERALLDLKPLFQSRPDLLRVPFRVMLHLLEQ